MGNWIVKNLKYLVDCALEVFSGDDGSCILCGKYCGETVDNLQLCPKCMSSIKMCRDSASIGVMGKSFKSYSSAYYSGGMKELVLRLKYKSDFRAGECISYYMKEVIAQEKLCFDIIACVPSSSSSYKKRGYNQSHVLAVDLGRLMDVPVSNPLVKVRETQDQIGLDEATRWSNMEGSFKVKEKRAVEYKKILLIDDVITTGATAFCCACALMDTGAAEVTILTAAKSRL